VDKERQMQIAAAAHEREREALFDGAFQARVECEELQRQVAALEGLVTTEKERADQLEQEHVEVAEVVNVEGNVAEERWRNGYVAMGTTRAELLATYEARVRKLRSDFCAIMSQLNEASLGKIMQFCFSMLRDGVVRVDEDADNVEVHVSLMNALELGLAVSCAWSLLEGEDAV